jgi:hypothetical protein
LAKFCEKKIRDVIIPREELYTESCGRQETTNSKISDHIISNNKTEELRRELFLRKQSTRFSTVKNPKIHINTENSFTNNKTFEDMVTPNFINRKKTFFNDSILAYTYDEEDEEEGVDDGFEQSFTNFKCTETDNLTVVSSGDACVNSNTIWVNEIFFNF